MAKHAWQTRPTEVRANLLSKAYGHAYFQGPRCLCLAVQFAGYAVERRMRTRNTQVPNLWRSTSRAGERASGYKHKPYQFAGRMEYALTWMRHTHLLKSKRETRSTRRQLLGRAKFDQGIPEVELVAADWYEEQGYGPEAMWLRCIYGARPDGDAVQEAFANEWIYLWQHSHANPD